MYKLLYINGISNFDTLRFDTLAEQTAYMNNHAVYTVDDYFPPHYTNKIRFLIEEVPLSTRTNYLSLTFSGKNYYYFITKIDYYNEDVYELTIEMDDIQTYMFDFSVVTADIDRMSIKRWTGNDIPVYINRDYVRENLSRGIFENVQFNTIKTSPFAIVASSQALFDNQIDVLPTVQYLDNESEINTGLYYYLVPAFSFPRNGTGKIRVENYDGTLVTEKAIYNDANFTFIKSCMSNPYIINIFYVNIPDNLLRYDFDDSYVLTIILDQNSSTWNKFFDINTLYPWAKLDNGGTLTEYPALNIIATDYSEIESTTHSLPGIRNANRLIDEPFNYGYIPQLVDENYYKFKYGEKADWTEYKLSVSKLDTYYCWNYLDINTSYRTYKITTSNDINDVYNNTKVVDNPTNIALLTDPWEQFVANNKNYKILQDRQWQTVIANGIMKEVSSYRDFMGDTVKAAQEDPLIIGGQYSLDKFNLARTGVSAQLVWEKNKLHNENLQNAPVALATTDSYYADKISKAIIPVVSIERVVDIEEAATKLEYYGYKVNKTVNNIDNIFNEFNIRYYYNVLKTANVKITGKILLTNEQIIRIESRLNEGLRLWNNPDLFDIGHGLTRDNIEIDFIQEDEGGDN